ncbi:MAG: aspartyl/glutamyl-tRNA amidotransferase subunit A [Candidatus Moranbacteria bacterium RBG_13_45_13]|nr:MAG: aspartyl/glutamyl-tRNA amidotransferase subunit A [Candidatus Moranbacteria bacterium RBG_13_45_13]
MIRDLHNKLVNQDITSEQLTSDYFSNIEKRDPEIKAYLSLNKEFALDKARAVDKKIKNGEEIDLLAGIPCSIKDVICTEGITTTAGSKVLGDYNPPYDATVISRLKANDAVILGKTNQDEFAMGSSTENSAYQTTKNPIDLERVPGGSSGGSAAAVAADMCVYSIGSDTGGSIRQPASFCGIVGFKPTYGAVSRYGLIAMASSFDQIGPLAKSVGDAAIIFSRITEKDRRDSTSMPLVDKRYENLLSGEVKKIKIGVPKEYFEGKGLDERVRKLIEEAMEKYEKLGAEIVDVSLPSGEYALATYYVIMPSEVSSNLARFDGIRFGQSIEKESDGKDLLLKDIYFKSRAKYLGKEVKRRIMLGTYALSAGYYDQYYLKAQKVRALIKKEFEEVFKKVDLILGPTAPTPAFKIGEKTENPLQMYLSDIYTVTANIVGLPAISIPCGTIEEDGKNLPVGVQLAGKWFDEETLLNAAYAFETN